MDVLFTLQAIAIAIAMCTCYARVANAFTVATTDAAHAARSMHVWIKN